MSCPKCNSEKIVKAGNYITKTFRMRKRWKCKDCKKYFVLTPHIGKLSQETINQIIRLSKRINSNASIYDHRKIRTYSHREISKILNVSTTEVLKILKKQRAMDVIL